MTLAPPLRTLSTIIGEVGAIGFSCLMALHVADRHVSEDDLMAIVHIESLSTLRKHLNFCAAHDYISMVKRSLKSSALWHITDLGRAFVLQALSLLGLPSASAGFPSGTAQPPVLAPAAPALDNSTEKNFFSTPSSSSDQIIQSGSDLTDQIEEEDSVEFKKFLCRKFGLTGGRAQQIIFDPRIWSEDLVAWLSYAKQLQRNGMKFRKSPEAYAIGCLLKSDGSEPDLPPKEAVHNSASALDMYWRQFCEQRKHHDDD